MSDIKQARESLVRRILEEEGKASPSDRRAAFNNHGLDEPLGTLADKVATRAYSVSNEDIAAVRAASLSEDEIFEIAVCAAIGQATRQYEIALAALDACSTATRKE
jgi:hypothetical protein